MSKFTTLQEVLDAAGRFAMRIGVLSVALASHSLLAGPTPFLKVREIVTLFYTTKL